MARVAIVGAGAIGCWLADAFDRAGWRVGLVARGATLAALHAVGLQVERRVTTRHSRPQAGNPEELGCQDYLVLTVKAHALPELAPSLAPLIGPETVIISGTNGIPWWFFAGFAGPLEDVSLQSVDPSGSQRAVFPADRTLGSVVHASVRALAPAHVQLVAVDRILIGEPGGLPTERSLAVVDALRRGGVNALLSSRIRAEIWAKLWGNMNMNPLSALTRSGTAALLADAEVRTLCLAMMEEMRACGLRLGLAGDSSAEERIAVTQRLGDFKTSMLADLEAGRPLEFLPQLGAVVEIAERLGEPAPFCRAILGLTRLRARVA
jgi:2-dehydropantoate 2-reductase